jgi:hypothetical protein
MGGMTAIAVSLTKIEALDTSKRMSTSIESDECRTWVQGGHVFVRNLNSPQVTIIMPATNLRKRNPFKSTNLPIDDEADDRVLDEQGVLISQSRE